MAVFSILTREEFLRWLGGAMVPQARTYLHKDVQQTGAGEILLAWAEIPSKPSFSNPPIISLPRNRMPEFFAFTSTYVSNYKPFSAFFRVVSHDVLEDLIGDRRVNAHQIDVPEELVAVALAEAYLQVGGGRSLEDITVQAGLATVSSSVIAALVNGYARDHVEQIILTWASAREIYVQERPKFAADTSVAFWSPIMDALDVREKSSHHYGAYQKAISFVRSQLTKGFDADPGAWTDLSQNLPDAMRSWGGTRTSSREDQVRNIDSASSFLVDAPNIEPLIREIIAGFLVARVSGGSIEYLNLCDPFLEKLPRAVLWFGFFVGCWRNGNVLSAGDCLGRRLARQLFGSSGPFAAPVADIGVHELGTFRGQPPRFRTEQQAVVSVELLPGVTARFRMRPESADARDRDASATRLSILRQLRSTLVAALGQIDKVQGEEPGLFGNLENDPRRGKSPKGVKRQGR
jgi:hypothetical protein